MVQDIKIQIVLSLLGKAYNMLETTFRKKVFGHSKTNNELNSLLGSALDDDEAKGILKALANKLVRALEERFKESGLSHEELMPVKIHLETILDRITFSSSLRDEFLDNPEAVEIYIKSLTKEGELEGLSAEQKMLIDEVLRNLAEPLLKVSFDLPHSVKLLLQQGNKLLQSVAEIQAHIIKISSTIEAFSQRGDFSQYETVYRSRLAERHDRMELLGLDNISPRLRQYQLNTSFVHLRLDTNQSSPTSITDALVEHHKLLLKGTAGSGKTTLLRWLTVMTARGEQIHPHWSAKLPILVTLREYDKKPLPETLRDLISLPNVMPYIDPQLLEKTLAERFQQGKVLVMIDGFDEVKREDEVKTWIADLIKLYPNAWYIISSRPIQQLENRIGLNQLNLSKVKFKNAQVESMNNTELNDLVTRWYQVAEHDYEDRSSASHKAGKLLGKIMQTPNLRSIADTPLLASAICAIDHYTTGGIPQKVHQIYETLIHMMVERRDRARGIKRDIGLDANAKIYLLATIAGRVVRTGDIHINSSDMKAELKSRLSVVSGKATVDDAYLYLVDRSGLIKQIGEDRLEFIHKTVLEYLASHLFVTENREDFAVDRFLDDQINQSGELSYFITVRSLKPWHLVEGMLVKLRVSHSQFDSFDFKEALLSIARTYQDCVVIPQNPRIIIEERYRELKNDHFFEMPKEDWEEVDKEMLEGRG